MNATTIACYVCDAEMVPKSKRHVTCSTECRKTWDYWRVITDPGYDEAKKAERDRRMARMKADKRFVCDVCGAPFGATKEGARYCSTECLAEDRRGPRLSTIIDQACVCGATFSVPRNRAGRRRFCAECLAQHRAADRRSPLRRAVEDGAVADVIAAMKDMVAIDPESGCWEWPRRRGRDGYGVVEVAGKRYAAHRLVMGNPEEPVVHHRCANRGCCNPDHLQLVTQRENAAEMLERNHYVRRIRDLEDALHSLNPRHPLIRMTMQEAI